MTVHDVNNTFELQPNNRKLDQITLTSNDNRKSNQILFTIIALLTNSKGFGPGFWYSDWRNSSCDKSNFESY